MTTVCPYCAQATVLPEPWPHPGYTCPYCRAVVPLGASSSNPFALDDADRSPPRRVHYRDRTTASDTFAQAFGRAMGEHAAGCIVVLATLSVFAAAAVWWFRLR